MAVLDGFPFQEEHEEQYSGGVRRSGLRSADHRENRNSSEVDDAVNHPGTRTGQEISQGNMEEGAGDSQGYMKCRSCHYQTKIESLLRRHSVKHSLDSDFLCPACDFRESDPCNFVEHIGTHQSGRLVRCCFCPKKMSRGKLKNHMKIHRPVEMYDCSMCQFSTNYEKTIKSHMDVYHTRKHSCQQCDLIMTKHDLHWHMKFQHAAEPKETASEHSFSSSVPAGRGKNSKAPRLHTKAFPNQSNISRKLGSSLICRKKSVALKLHKHVIAKKQFNCGKCDYKTSFKKLLRAHRAKHSLDNSLVCTKCGYKETGVGKFAAHLALHSPNDSFECCFCSFVTPNRGTMSNHVCKHKPVPMFDCSECEFSAKRGASVRKHMANVHGKKSRCKSCGVEMSRFAMLQHQAMCQGRLISDSGAGTYLQNLGSDSYEAGAEPDDACGEGVRPLDENTVTCEFCLKSYAKSYLRKHLKRCQPEKFPDSGHAKTSELAIAPESQPIGIALVNRKDATLASGTNDVTGLPESSSWSVVGSVQSKSPGKIDKPRKPRLQCFSCPFETRTKRLLRKHVVKHLIDFRLTCPDCGFKEMSSYLFARHLFEHGLDPRTFQCCYCPYTAPTRKRTHKAHLDLHRPVNIYDCPKCEYSSNRADCVRNHYKNNHTKNRKCHHCGEVMSKVRLVKHLLEFHGELRDVDKFKLKVIDPVVVEASTSNSHAQTLDPNPEQNLTGQCNQSEYEMHELVGSSYTAHKDAFYNEEAPPFESDQDFLQCTKCSFRTKILTLMDRHAAKHLQDVPFVCPLCGFEHMSSRKFANHWDKHECNAKKVYQCCFCDVEIKKKNCLKAFLPLHIEGHRRVPLQDCPECEFSSHSQYERDKHYKNQHVKQCECLLCGEVMSIFEHSFHTECKGVQNDLDCGGTAGRSIGSSRLRQKSGEVQESLVAVSNDAALLDESSLEQDQPESHPSVTNHMQCSDCDFQTLIKSLFDRHLQKHRIDVPFSCMECSFSSFDEKTFAEHIYSHSRSYKCHFCNFKARSVSVATRHLSSHKAVAMHDCSKCEFTSKYKFRLNEHMRGGHSDNPRCSYCLKKIPKNELYSHEDECGKYLRGESTESLRGNGFPDDRLSSTSTDTSPLKGFEESATTEAPFRHPDLNDRKKRILNEKLEGHDATAVERSLHLPSIPILRNSVTGIGILELSAAVSKRKSAEVPPSHVISEARVSENIKFLDSVPETSTFHNLEQVPNKSILEAGQNPVQND